MKKILLIILPLLLIVGCSKEPINFETTLVKRNGVFYTKDTNKPYSGPVFSLFNNGRKKREIILEDGKMIIYKDLLWYENGQKWLEETYKDGELVNMTFWYENGQKSSEETWDDDGELISEKCWDKDGSETDCY